MTLRLKGNVTYHEGVAWNMRKWKRSMQEADTSYRIRSEEFSSFYKKKKRKRREKRLILGTYLKLGQHWNKEGYKVPRIWQANEGNERLLPLMKLLLCFKPKKINGGIYIWSLRGWWREKEKKKKVFDGWFR